MLPLVTQPSQWQKFVLELTTSLKWDWHRCEQFKAEHTTITRRTNTSALHSVQPASGLVFSQTRFRVHNCFRCKSFSTHVFVHNALRLITSCWGDAADCTHTYAEVSEYSQDWGCSFGLVMSAAEIKPQGPHWDPSKWECSRICMHLKMLPEAAQLTDDMRARNMEQTHTSAAAFISVGWTQWGCCSLRTTCRPPPHTRLMLARRNER